MGVPSLADHPANPVELVVEKVVRAPCGPQGRRIVEANQAQPGPQEGAVLSRAARIGLPARAVIGQTDSCRWIDCAFNLWHEQ